MTPAQGRQIAAHRGLRRVAFAHHEVVRLDRDRVVVARPRDADLSFEVVALGYGATVVHGDIEAVVFQGEVGGDVIERVCWLASKTTEAARRKATVAGGHRYLKFDAVALAEAVDAWAASLSEDGAPLDPDGRRLVRRAAALSRELREGDAEENHALAAALDLGVDLEGSPHCIFDDSLLTAHAAARCAFALLRPDRMYARFDRDPSAAKLAEYNLAVRGMRSATASHAARQIAFEASDRGAW